MRAYCVGMHFRFHESHVRTRPQTLIVLLWREQEQKPHVVLFIRSTEFLSPYSNMLRYSVRTRNKRIEYASQNMFVCPPPSHEVSIFLYNIYLQLWCHLVLYHSVCDWCPPTFGFYLDIRVLYETVVFHGILHTDVDVFDKSSAGHTNSARGDNCHYSTDHVSCRNVISLFLLFNSKYFLAFVCLFFFATDVRAQTHELLLRSNSFNVIVATQESTGGLFSLYRTIQPQCSPTKLVIWFKKKNVKYPAGIFGCKEDGEQNPTDIQSRKKDVGFFHALSHEQLRTWPLTFSVFDIALD